MINAPLILELVLVWDIYDDFLARRLSERPGSR